MAHGIFVTGTDTGVGKTLAACALLHAYAQRGERVIGMKPVAAGLDEVAGQSINADVAALGAASNVVAPLASVNPYAFAPPIAPHLAARRAGETIDLSRIADAYRDLAARAERVIVEGAGGALVPLNERDDMLDLARVLGLPVVLVVGVRLGCINHALLTAAAIRARGLHLAAWIANTLDPHLPALEDHLAALRTRLIAPCLGTIPHLGQHADPLRYAAGVAVQLDLKALDGLRFLRDASHSC
jgi:dethiobiotin synthetase